MARCASSGTVEGYWGSRGVFVGTQGRAIEGGVGTEQSVRLDSRSAGTASCRLDGRN